MIYTIITLDNLSLSNEVALTLVAFLMYSTNRIFKVNCTCSTFQHCILIIGFCYSTSWCCCLCLFGFAPFAAGCVSNDRCLLFCTPSCSTVYLSTVEGRECSGKCGCVLMKALAMRILLYLYHSQWNTETRSCVFNFKASLLNCTQFPASLLHWEIGCLSADNNTVWASGFQLHCWGHRWRKSHICIQAKQTWADKPVIISSKKIKKCTLLFTVQ